MWELRLQRAIVLRAAKRIQVGVCGRAFMKWVDAAAELRREREEHEAAVREAAAAEARKHAVLSRVARLWSSEVICGCGCCGEEEGSDACNCGGGDDTSGLWSSTRGIL